MQEIVEHYRGIPIYRSEIVLCDPVVARQVHEAYEAQVEGWKLVGTLQGVREEIDRRLGRERNGS